jgi:hypothetical protein
MHRKFSGGNRRSLSDAEWSLIESYFLAPESPERLRVHLLLRVILDAVFYVVRGGCAWRLLPHDLDPPGIPLTTISELGASTVLGSGCTRTYAGGRGYASRESHSPMPLASSTARAS